MSNSVTSAASPVSPYCSLTNLNAPGIYDYSGSPWDYPYTVCGAGGIAAPTGTLSCQVDFHDGYGCVTTQDEPSPGVYEPYAALISGSNITNAGGTSGTMFQDGYAFNAKYISVTGLTYASFSASCKSGYTPNSNGTTITYKPGTPTTDSAGDFVCGGTSIASGTLAGYW